MTSPESLLVPEGTRLIHIGPHKTGSTAIQQALHEARPRLAEHGVHFAGKGLRPRKAGWALDLPGRPVGSEIPPMRHWERLVADVRSAGGQRVCISNEDFGRADPDQVERIVTDLGGGRPHVVAAVRRLDGYLPSQWQERVKAGGTRGYEEWLRVVLDGTPEDWDNRNVWGAHDVGALVRRWADRVGEESITLLVLPDSDPGFLPASFERLLGLPSGHLAVRPDRGNRGLTWGEVEMVLALNRAAQHHRWSREVRRAFLREGVVQALRSGSAEVTSPRTPPMAPWALERVRELSDVRVETVKRLGVRVVGDPEHLRVPEAGPDRPAGPASVTAATAAAAVESAVLVALARHDPHEGP